MVQRFVATAGLGQRAAEVGVRIGRRRAAARRRVAGGEGLGEPVGREQQHAELLMRFGEVGVERERPRELDERLLRLAGLGQHLRQVEVQVRVPRGERGRAAEVAERGRRVARAPAARPPR